jgi:predicted extracellular nuclease
MKRVLLYFLVFALFSCEEEGSAKNNSKQSINKPTFIEKLKGYADHPIVFYNVENLFDTINDPNTNDDEFTPEGSKEWGSRRYEDKLNKLSQVITTPSENNPLFIGLAEIENRFVVLDLIQTGRLSKTKYRIAHFNSPDQRGIDVALAFDLERFFLLHSEAIPIKIKGNDDFKTRDILYVKGLLQDSVQLHIFVNHWSSRRGGQEKSEHKRVLAAQILKSKSDSILGIDTNANIIIMGDFNDYPTNMSITETLAAKSIQESGPNEFINLLAPQHAAGKGTHNYRGKWGALDQIIISPSLKEGKTLRIKDNEAHILYKDFLLYEHPSGDKTPSKTYGGPNYYGGYSDHLAVYTFLESVSHQKH